MLGVHARAFLWRKAYLDDTNKNIYYLLELSNLASKWLKGLSFLKTEEEIGGQKRKIPNSGLSTGQ